jgi:hypothetical protein
MKIFAHQCIDNFMHVSRCVVNFMPVPRCIGNFMPPPGKKFLLPYSFPNFCAMAALEVLGSLV